MSVFTIVTCCSIMGGDLRVERATASDRTTGLETKPSTNDNPQEAAGENDPEKRSHAAQPTAAAAVTEKAGKSAGKPFFCVYCTELSDQLMVGVKLETRGRVENWKDPGGSGEPNRGLLRNRLLLEGEWKGIGATLEWIDAREAFTPPSERSQINSIDVVQANVHWRELLNAPWSLRVGRQTINVGSRRLIAAPTWKNLIRAFEAARLTGRPHADWMLDVFAGRRVIIDSDEFDNWNNGEFLWGAFAQTESIPGLVAEAYLFGLHQGDTSAKQAPITGEDGKPGRTDRYTPGVRVDWRPLGGLRLELEAMLQFGHRANDSILAFAGEVDAYYTFDSWGHPTLQWQYSVASGDPDSSDGRSNTFIPLFASVHRFHGHLDLFRAQNLHQAAFVQMLKPFEGLGLRTGLHAFWLYTPNDNWYNTTGKVVRPASDGLPGGLIGVEIDGMIRWAVFPFWEVEVGGGVFFSRWQPAPPRSAFVWVQMLFRAGVLASG